MVSIRFSLLVFFGFICASYAFKPDFLDLPFQLDEEFSTLRNLNESEILAMIPVPYETRARYIEMRDGVGLWAAIYKPLFGKTHGTILERTSYTTVYAAALALRWVPLGFVVILQDQRGTGLSKGDSFHYWRKDGDDGYDTMAWIASQSWSNGNIFLTGASSMGNAAIAGLLNYPPNIRAAGPSVATGRGHATTFQGGAYRDGLISSWLTLLGLRDTITEVKNNEAFSEWWDPIEFRGKEDRCTIPAIHGTGWYDIFLNEHIDAFNACQYVTNAAGKGRQKIVINPHGHCLGGEYIWPGGWSTLAPSLRVDLFRSENGDEVDPVLKKKLADVQAITMYVMGPERADVGNYWTTVPHWPAHNLTSFYLHPDYTIQTVPSNVIGANTSYIYDPANPVRTHGGNELFGLCGPRDQSTSEERDDVIIFTSSPFTTSTPIIGNLSAVIYVGSDAIDTDFTVKLTDVYPNGKKSMLLNDGIIRMRWRDSREVPTTMKVGEVYEVTVDLWKTAYIFNEGHSLRVAISSSNSPRFLPNPNNGLPVNQEGENIIARNTIYHGRDYPSRVILPIASMSDIPENFANDI